MTAYRSFLEAKLAISQHSGFAVPADSIHPMLKPHQRDIVRWALLGGRRAVFAAFGLGKSFMQLEIMRQIVRKEGGLQLIIAPLGVRQEFKADAAKLGMGLAFIRRDEEISNPGLYLTNYESVRDGRLHVEHFNAASLDEASVLRSFGSLTYQTFLTLFESVKYRFVATATPSPNRYKELIHYAGFLGVMDTGQALTRFFKRGSTQANNLTLYPHMEREFWLWVNSWAVFLQKPSDLGYSDEGYDLPRLHVHYHKVTTGLPQACDKHGQLQLVDNAAMGLQAASRARWQIDAHAFWRSSGNRLMTAEEMAFLTPDVLAGYFTKASLADIYDYEEHVCVGERLDAKGALPCAFMALAPGSHSEWVWHDVTRMRTLNGKQAQRGLQQHVCPLQFDIVDRIINRYSNPGDLVYDPFGGLMTVPYRAVLLGRRGYGCELNAGYFLDGVKYLRAAEQDVSAPSLFDLCGVARTGGAA